MSRDYKNFPNNLRKHRKGMNLSQRDVANVLGFKNASLISRWERGITLPSGILLFKLSALYGRQIEELFIDHYRAIKEEVLTKKEEILKSRQDSNEKK
mgnify:CR=1 FL=1